MLAMKSHKKAAEDPGYRPRVGDKQQTHAQTHALTHKHTRVRNANERPLHSGNSCIRYRLSAQVCLSLGAYGNPPWSPGSQ